MTKTETIQALYAAFGRGDVPGILSHLSDDVSWDNSRVASREVPWNGNFSGKTNVPGFFKAVGDELDFSVFEPNTFVESGSHVIALLHLESKLKRNQRPLVNDVVHVWTFNDRGQVSSYRHYNDTALELAAWTSA